MISSNKNSKSTNVVLQMLDDISSRGSIDKRQLFAYYVQCRLDKSINTYYKQLLDSKKTLEHISNKRVIKHLID